MIVLTDSFCHRVEAASIKLGGSANGHNGVKSIISILGSWKPNGLSPIAPGHRP